MAAAFVNAKHLAMSIPVSRNDDPQTTVDRENTAVPTVPRASISQSFNSVITATPVLQLDHSVFPPVSVAPTPAAGVFSKQLHPYVTSGRQQLRWPKRADSAINMLAEPMTQWDPSCGFSAQRVAALACCMIWAAARGSTCAARLESCVCFFPSTSSLRLCGCRPWRRGIRTPSDSSWAGCTLCRRLLITARVSALPARGARRRLVQGAVRMLECVNHSDGLDLMAKVQPSVSWAG